MLTFKTLKILRSTARYYINYNDLDIYFYSRMIIFRKIRGGSLEIVDIAEVFTTLLLTDKLKL